MIGPTSNSAYLPPGEGLACARFVQIEGHSFPYPSHLLQDIPPALPNFTIECEGKTLHFSREVISKISGLFAPAQSYLEKEGFLIREQKMDDITFLFKQTLSEEPFPELDEDATWRYFSLAQYLQLHRAEGELARRYILIRLNKVNESKQGPVIEEELVEPLIPFLTDLSSFASIEPLLGQMIEWPWVRQLDIHGNRSVNEGAIALIGQMASLESLNVDNLPHLGDRAVSHLTGLTNLRTLDMSRASSILYTTTLGQLSCLTNLTDLKLNHSQTATTDSLSALKGLPLVNLELQGCGVLLSQLHKFSLLTRLDYSVHINVSNEEVDETFSAIPSLNELVL